MATKENLPLTAPDAAAEPPAKRRKLSPQQPDVEVDATGCLVARESGGVGGSTTTFAGVDLLSGKVGAESAGVRVCEVRLGICGSARPALLAWREVE